MFCDFVSVVLGLVIVTWNKNSSVTVMCLKYVSIDLVRLQNYLVNDNSVE